MRCRRLSDSESQDSTGNIVAGSVLLSDLENDDDDDVVTL